MNLINIFITAFLTENIVLTKFLGICPFVGTSSKEKSALGMGLAVTFVITMSSIITYLIYHYLLVPTDTTYLRTIFFILVIAFLVEITEIILKKYNKKLYKALGIYLPLITTNCAVFGITLLNINNGYNFLEMLFFSLGSSLGFTAVIYVFATIRERLTNVPKPLQGYPIAFFIAGIMSLLASKI